MNNEGSWEGDSIDRRLQVLKEKVIRGGDAQRPDRAARLTAEDNPTSLLSELAKTEQDANQAGVYGLSHGRGKVAERSASASTTHEEAIKSLAEASAATADANDPQAMVARHRVEQIRRELKNEQ